MDKKVLFEKEVRDGLYNGIRILSKAVTSTLGPKGRNVVIQPQYGPIVVTKDGVTVAKHTILQDPLDKLGSEIVKQAAQQTASVAGDGTTTATLLAYGLVSEYLPLVNSGTSPIDAKRKIEEMTEKVVAAIEQEATPVTQEDIYKIAAISANNDEKIGTLIGDAYKEVGREGVITVESSRTGHTYTTFSEGATFNRGYLSPYFVTDPKKDEAVLDDPYILVTNMKLSAIQDVLPILEKVNAKGKGLVIVADSVEGQVLQVLAMNTAMGNLKCVAINAPSFGDNRMDLLGDLAALTGAELLSLNSGKRIEDTTLEQLGRCKKVISRREETIFVDTKIDKERVDLRVEQIKNLLENADGEAYLTKQLQERYARLAAKVCTLHVGASTETEMEEIKSRVDDALRATRSSIMKGYVVGGGTLFARLSKSLIKDASPLEKAFLNALAYPVKKIAQNAGLVPEVVLEKVTQVEDKNFGFDAKNLEYKDLVKNGVIDPALVLEQAIKNASSAASMVLLCDTAIFHADQSKPVYEPGSLDEYGQQ
jgi:chaperonin GroEL